MSNLIEKAAQRLNQLRQSGALPQDSLATSAQTERLSDSPEIPAPAADFQSEKVDLDLAALERSGFVVPSAQRSRRGEEFRIIKRPLILNAAGKGASPVRRGNLIMVSSALPGEGKSFTALNLALSIAAELDHTVLLVDSDVARPSMPRMLGLDPERKGLLDLLSGSASMTDVLLRTNVPKLSVLPSGKPRAHATEMLGSESMNQLLEEMAARYADRIIIFDSPPLLMTTEARVLASHVGQLVMVVHAGRTLQSQVRSALAAVQATPVRLMLLNQAVGQQQDEYGYGYSYGYGYGYGYEAGSTPSSAGASQA